VPPHGRRAGRGVRTPGTALFGRAWQLQRARAQSCVPAAGVRAVASLVCVRAHRASALSRSSRRSRSIVRAAVAAGWYSRRPTDRRGIGRREAHSLQREQSFPSSRARRFAAGACGRWASTHAERRAIRGEPQVRTFQCDTQLGAPLGSPPPGHPPYLVQRDATPKVGASPVSWRICRWPGLATCCRQALPRVTP
jgi:hypothetical protein